MIETTIIIVICIALVVSLSVTAAAQRREKVQQSKRLQVSKLRHKANQIQDLMEWLNANIGEPSTSSILADLVISYLQQIQQIDPAAANVEQNIRSLTELSQNPPPKQAIKPPPNNGELNALVNKISRIIELINKMAQSGSIPAMRANTATQNLKVIYFKILIDGHIKLGREAYSSGQMGSAVQHFSFAQEKLLKCNLDEEDVQERTKTISEYIAQMTEQNKEKHQQEIKEKELAEATAKAQADPTKGDTTGLGNSDALFSDKKKW